jgi:hypothetical protein
VGEDRSTTEHGPNRRRFTVAEAAQVLGITAEAVRTRIKRGKLESIKEPPGHRGTVYVLLDADQTGPNPDPTSQGVDQTPDQTQKRDEVVDALREQVAYLQGVIATRDRELEQRTEEIRRRDAALEREQQLTAMFATRLGELDPPQVETPQETRESPVSPGPTETPPDTPVFPQTGSQSPRSGGLRGLRRRILGW